MSHPGVGISTDALPHVFDLSASTPLEREDAGDGHLGSRWDFSLDASVRIEADDRLGLERLLRYCARPALALERLLEIDAEHVYESVKPGAGGSVSLMLTHSN